MITMFDQSLIDLLLREGQTGIVQHPMAPHPNEWYVARYGSIALGAFTSHGEALTALLNHLWNRYDEVCAERDRVAAERDGLRRDLEEARATLRATNGAIQRLSEQRGPRR